MTKIDMDFKIPNVGENITSGTVVAILVAVGDAVKKGQDLLELETEKASMPIPSPADGVIKEILIKKGDEVKIGQAVMKVEEKAGAVASTTPAKPASTAAKPTAETKAPPPQKTSAPSAVAQTVAAHSAKDIKLVVIGAGPGGYAAAFLAADLGLNVTLIDREANPGGICLYRGCIPSKALLHVAKLIADSKDAPHFGVVFEPAKIDLNKLRQWKEDIVSKLTGGLGQMTRMRKVNYIQGEAVFKNSNTLTIKRADGKTEEFTFTHAIVATGSRPIMLPGTPNSKHIWDSTSALKLEEIPRTMLVLGGGYIGLELGMAYAELGSKISVVEMTPGLLPGADRDLTAVLTKRAETIFDQIFLETKVVKMEESANGITVTFQTKDGKETRQEFNKVLVAIGRRPNWENIGLENTKVQLTEKKFIKVNAQRQSDDPAIYAIGDIAGDPMLAHKASHEGRTAVEAIAGHKVAFEPKAIPAVVFTDPEIAWAGLTETEAKAQNRKYEVVKFPWAASGRAMTLDRDDGLTKLLVDPDTQRVLGVAIVGPGAGDLIAEGVLAIEMGANVTDVKLTIHPHPTLSETVMEAAEVFFGQSTHVYRPKK